MATTSLSLGEHWEAFIKNEISSGRYGSASEVVRDALRAMEERQKRPVAILVDLQGPKLRIGKFEQAQELWEARPEAMQAFLSAHLDEASEHFDVAREVTDVPTQGEDGA